MQLSIATLKEAAAFTGKPVKKVIEWKGHKFECYIRPLSYQTAMGDINAYHTGDVIANRIASSICDKDGRPVFKVADITGEQQYEGEGKDRKPVGDAVGALDGELSNKLIIAISEVQNSGKIAS